MITHNSVCTISRIESGKFFIHFVIDYRADIIVNNVSGEENQVGVFTIDQFYIFIQLCFTCVVSQVNVACHNNSKRGALLKPLSIIIEFNSVSLD